MENIYDLHQHTHCVIMHIKKSYVATYIFATSNRYFSSALPNEVQLGSSITYNKQRTAVKYVGFNFEEKDGDNILIDNFRDKLYNLFKKGKETWDEEDKFLMKAISDYLPAVMKNTLDVMKLEIENFDSFHYVFVIPSEWEEEIRDDIIRPIFVQSGLISNQDHQDRLLFFTDIEAIFYNYSFSRGQNTILCRLSPEEEQIIVKFDLIQTMTTLFNVPNAKFFPKVMKSSTVSVTEVEIEDRIRDFLNANLFSVPIIDDGDPSRSLKRFIQSKLAPSIQNRIIEAIIHEIYTRPFPSLRKENEEKEPWITSKKRWMLSESQKKFINSLCPSIIYAEIGGFLLGYMKDIISNNFTKSYNFLLVVDHYSDRDDVLEDGIAWLKSILACNKRSLSSLVEITMIDSEVNVIRPEFILKGAGIGISEAIQHSDIYCKPRVTPPINLTASSSVFLNSKPNAIINLDISLGSTIFTCSLLNEEGLIHQIFDHDCLIGDKHLPLLKHFYTFSNTVTLTVEEQFIPFAERYLLGDLDDFTENNGVSIKKELLFEMKALLTNDLSGGEVLVSTGNQKHIKAFMLMYMIYIKEEILYKLQDQLISDQRDMKIGYAVSIEAMLLNKTIESKDNLRDIIYASALVPRDDYSKKLRIITQGEGTLPAIQKSLKLELTLKSYFLLCQLHEDYVQLSLHQVVTEPSSEGKDQESIIIQDEIVAVQNIYDSVCSNMWHNLLQDNSSIELCEMHNTSDNSKYFYLFSSKVKTDFFANLKVHISDNILQNNPSVQSTDTINLTSYCNCKVHLTTSDIIDISFAPVLQDIAYTLYASLLNKELFGNYINIDYLFSFIRFNNNPQLQYAFAKILEEEADDFNLELGIDTSCLVVPEILSQLLQPVISQQPFGYRDFRTGALQQVYSENYVFRISQGEFESENPIYKSRITDTNPIECGFDVAFPLLNKGDRINGGLNRKFYLRSKKERLLAKFVMDVYRFKTMNYSENNETFSLQDNTHQCVDTANILFDYLFELKGVDIPVIVSISYLAYASSLQFYVKLAGVGTGEKYFTAVVETGEPLTLTRF